MSGVLAPFFTPGNSSGSSSGRLSFLNNPDSPTSIEQQQQQQQQQQAALASLSLPLLNGSINSSGDSLYWALKNSSGNLGIGLGGLGLDNSQIDHESDGDGREIERDDDCLERDSSPLLLSGKQIKTEPGVEELPMNMAMTSGLNLNPNSSEMRMMGGSHSGQRNVHHEKENNDGEEELERSTSIVDGASGAGGRRRNTTKTTTTRRRRPSQSVIEEEDDDEDENDESLLISSGGKRRKRGKISCFRCSFCQMTFTSRLDCSTHIEQSHSVLRRRKKNFRCRKCKFTSHQYQKLVVHSRVHHSSTPLRGFQVNKHRFFFFFS